MIKIGLTGNRYSGKDTVANLFEQIGIPVFNADVILKFILNFDINVNKDILDNYGEYIFTGADSMIDPKKIRSKKDFDKLVNFAEFELKRAYEKFILENRQSLYTIFHSSIIFERGWQKDMDYTINVFAPKGVRSFRCERITKQSTYNISELIKGEMEDLIKNKLATYTVHNYDGATLSFGDVCDQVNRIDRKIIDKYLIKEQTLAI
jgi:dephospho-CoA kinase